ncbi:protein kinase (incomplete catalytic triad), partial [Cystoisospora suis]
GGRRRLSTFHLGGSSLGKDLDAVELSNWRRRNLKLLEELLQQQPSTVADSLHRTYSFALPPLPASVSAHLNKQTGELLDVPPSQNIFPTLSRRGVSTDSPSSCSVPSADATREMCLCEVALTSSTTAGTASSRQSSSPAVSPEAFPQPSLASLVKFTGRATRLESKHRLYKGTSAILGHGFSGDVKIYKHRHTRETFALKTVLDSQERDKRRSRFCLRRSSRLAVQIDGRGKNSVHRQQLLGGSYAKAAKAAAEANGVQPGQFHKLGTFVPAASSPTDEDMRRDLLAIMGEGVYAFLCVDHPCIVKLLELVEDEEGVHLIMPVCTGRSLSREAIRRCLPGIDHSLLPSTTKLKDRTLVCTVQESRMLEEWHSRTWERATKKFAWQMLKALKHLHTHGIVHRDVKAENFMLRESSSARLVLIDFGFSIFTATDDINNRRALLPSGDMETWSGQPHSTGSTGTCKGAEKTGPCRFSRLPSPDENGGRERCFSGSTDLAEAFLLSCLTRESWRGPSPVIDRRVVGTPGLHPPEVLAESTYSPATDMWGLGLVLHALLTGSVMPALAGGGRLLLDDSHSRLLSVEGRDFLERCLRRRQASRMTAVEALDHPWLQEERSEEEGRIAQLVARAKENDSRVMRMIANLRRFPVAPLFHRLFYLLLAYALPASEICDELETLFYALDRSKRGMIFYDDFLTGLRSLDVAIDETEAFEIFTSMYTSTRTVYSSSGCCLHQAVQALEFTPFIAGAIDKESLLHANSLKRLFSRMDLEGTGRVGAQQIIGLLGAGAGKLREELRGYFVDVGMEEDGSFTFEELATAISREKGLEALFSRTGLAHQHALLSPQAAQFTSKVNKPSHGCLRRRLWAPLAGAVFFFKRQKSGRKGEGPSFRETGKAQALGDLARRTGERAEDSPPRSPTRKLALCCGGASSSVLIESGEHRHISQLSDRQDDAEKALSTSPKRNRTRVFYSVARNGLCRVPLSAMEGRAQGREQPRLTDQRRKVQNGRMFSLFPGRHKTRPAITASPSLCSGADPDGKRLSSSDVREGKE